MPEDSEDKKRKGGKKLDRKDLSLWKRFTEDITPMRPVDWSALEDDAGPAPAAEGTIRERVMPPPAPVREKPRSQQPPQIDRRTEEKLRKGQMEIEAQIDLHGKSQQRAYEVLQQFMASSHRRGLRCVLVITGKGRSHGGEYSEEWIFNDSVLRQRVPEWLSVPPLSEMTLKHFPAQPRHGGEGAYYVYLRRVRDYSP